MLIVIKHLFPKVLIVAPVFQSWFRRKLEAGRQPWPECPLPDFERHICTLGELLCAYAEVRQKPPGWAEGILTVWGKQLSQRGAEAEDELECRLQQIINSESESARISNAGHVQHEGRKGTLYVTEAAPLLGALSNHSGRDTSLPKNATGLSRRLRSAKFRAFRFLDHETAPQLPRQRLYLVAGRPRRKQLPRV